MDAPKSDTVVITKLLVQRREFWWAVIVLITAIVVILLGTLYFYPEVLSEIVHLWEDEEPTYYAPRLLEPYDYDVQKWLGVPTAEPTITP